MRELADKVAVITGAASGVGKELALRFARAGARIVLADIEPEALDKAVEEVRATGAKAIGQRTDVTDRAQVDALRDRAFGEFGKVHLVINNAGVSGGGGEAVWESSKTSFRWAMDVNFYGPLHGLQSFMPRLIEQGEEALMAATTSGAALIPPPNAASYSASKAALIALWETLAQQLLMRGSKVKAALLFPGPHIVDTRLFTATRNLQADYADGTIGASGVETVAQLQGLLQTMIGRPVEITRPEDFAEEVYRSILRDDFWILPLNDKLTGAMRDRTEAMIHRGQPAIVDIY